MKKWDSVCLPAMCWWDDGPSPPDKVSDIFKFWSGSSAPKSQFDWQLVTKTLLHFFIGQNSRWHSCISYRRSSAHIRRKRVLYIIDTKVWNWDTVCVTLKSYECIHVMAVQTWLHPSAIVQPNRKRHWFPWLQSRKKFWKIWNNGKP